MQEWCNRIAHQATYLEGAKAIGSSTLSFCTTLPIRMKQNKINEISKEEFNSLVQSSSSYRELAVKLQVENDDGTIHRLKARVARDMITLPENFSKRKRKEVCKEWFIVGYVNRTSLRNKVIRDGDLEYRCAECGLAKWQGRPLSLQLEHKDGDPLNNLKENLCFLCPNCHSQTATYSRNKPRS